MIVIETGTPAAGWLETWGNRHELIFRRDGPPHSGALWLHLQSFADQPGRWFLSAEFLRIYDYLLSSSTLAGARVEAAGIVAEWLRKMAVEIEGANP